MLETPFSCGVQDKERSNGILPVRRHKYHVFRHSVYYCNRVPIRIGIIIGRSVKGARQWKRNNDSPVLSVSSTVVAKRADVSCHHHHDMNTMSHTTSSTIYYVTFQVESGDRMEFAVRDTEYGLLVEGDAGKLTFQGTRYLGFERQR